MIRLLPLLLLAACAAPTRKPARPVVKPVTLEAVLDLADEERVHHYELSPEALATIQANYKALIDYAKALEER